MGDMFPMILTRNQLRLAALVYCQEHNLPVGLYLTRVEAETINAGLVVLIGV